MKISRELIDKIKEYLKEQHKLKNKLIKFSEVAKQFNIDKETAIQVYRILVKEGFLVKNKTRYKIEENKKISDILKNQIIDLPLLIIRFIMFCIGMGAAYLSIWYTGKWMLEFLKPFLAYMLSTIMVLFSIIVFEVIIILLKNRQIIIIFILSVLWLIVLLFSMVSTIAGQYNQRITNENIDIIESADILIDKKHYDLLLEEEKEIKINIDNKKQELKIFQGIMKNFKTIEDREKDKWLYWDTYEKIKKINSEIEKKRDELKNKRDEIKTYFKEKKDEQEIVGAIEDTQIKNKPFYEWISEIIKAEVRFIEFWMSVFPAIFIDIIAPLALAISMFLKRKRQ